MKSLIDYREYDKGAAATNLPSMKDSFSEIPYEGKDLIVKYLENGEKRQLLLAGQKMPLRARRYRVNIA